MHAYKLFAWNSNVSWQQHCTMIGQHANTSCMTASTCSCFSSNTPLNWSHLLVSSEEEGGVVLHEERGVVHRRKPLSLPTVFFHNDKIIHKHSELWRNYRSRTKCNRAWQGKGVWSHGQVKCSRVLAVIITTFLLPLNSEPLKSQWGPAH